MELQSGKVISLPTTKGQASSFQNKELSRGEGKPFISTCINKSTLSNDEDMRNDQVILELLKEIEAMSLRMDSLSYEEHTDRVVSCFIQGGNTKEAALNIYLDWLSTEN